MKLERPEKLITVKTETYKGFKERINITKKYRGKAKVTIFDEYVLVEKERYIG